MTEKKPECCVEIPVRGMSMRFRHCQKQVTVVHDGKPYCATHNPERVEIRKAVQNSRFARQARMRRIELHAHKMLALLIESQKGMTVDWLQRRNALIKELTE